MAWNGAGDGAVRRSVPCGCGPAASSGAVTALSWRGLALGSLGSGAGQARAPWPCLVEPPWGRACGRPVLVPHRPPRDGQRLLRRTPPSVLTAVPGSASCLFLTLLAKEPRWSSNAVSCVFCSAATMETKGKRKFAGKSGKVPYGKAPHGKRKFKKDSGKKTKFPNRSPF